MNRRNFVLGSTALALVPTAAKAELRCSNFNYNGVQYCEAGIPSIRLIPARQICPLWCWAASIQMTFASQGRIVDQRDIVRRLFSDERCSTASGRQIARTVNSGAWSDQYGRRFYAEAVTLADFDFGVGDISAAARAAQYLAAGFPLINGAVGHATVLTSMRYYRDVYGRGQVESLVVRDPWPGRPSRRTLTAREVAGTRLLLAVEI